MIPLGTPLMREKRGMEGWGGGGRRYPYNRETDSVPSRPSGEGRYGTMLCNEEGKLMESGLFGCIAEGKVSVWTNGYFSNV